MPEITIDANEYHHLAVKWTSDGKAVSVYIDGTLVASGTLTSDMPQFNTLTENTIGIGGVVSGAGNDSLADGGNSINAELDEITIWDRQLTVAEITSIAGTYSGTPTSPPSSQTAVGKHHIRVSPDAIKLYIPCDNITGFPTGAYEGKSVGGASADYIDGDASGLYDLLRRAAFSFDFNALIAEALSAAGSYDDFDVDLIPGTPSNGYTDEFDTRNIANNQRNAYKLYEIDNSADGTHGFIFVESAAVAGSLINLVLAGAPFTVAAGKNITSQRAMLTRNLISDGDMESTGTRMWVALGATISKSASRDQGLQSLTCSAASASDGAYQLIEGNITAAYQVTLNTHSDELDYVVFLAFRQDSAAATNPICFIKDTSTVGSHYIDWGQYKEDGTAISGLATWHRLCFVTRGANEIPIYSGVEIYLKAVGAGNVFWDAVKCLPSEIKFGKFPTGATTEAEASGPTNYVWRYSSGSTISLNQGTGAMNDRHSGGFRGRFQASGAESKLSQRFEPRGHRGHIAVAYVKNIGLSAVNCILEILGNDGSTVLASHTESVTNGASNFTKMSVMFFSENGATNTHTFRLRVPASSDWQVDDCYVLALHHVPMTLKPSPEVSMLTPTQDMQGVLFYPNQTGLAYANIIVNPNEIGFLIRLRSHFTSTIEAADAPIFFEWKQGASNLLQLTYTGAKFQLLYIGAGASVTLAEGTGTAPTWDEEIEISGWIDTAGRSIDGTTYYGKLFVNGVQKASTAVAQTAMASYEGTLTIGASDDTLNPARAIIDQFYLFVEAPTDDELKAMYVEQEPLNNSNAVYSIVKSIAAGDYARLDFLTQTYQHYTISDGAKAAIGASTGKPIILLPVGTRRGWVLISQTLQELIVRYRKQWL